MPKTAVVAADDLAGALLGDPRRVKRLVSMATALDARPGDGLPRAMGSGAGLEGAYRLLSNAAVGYEPILAAHVAATAVRAANVSGEVIVAHDTTELRFGGTSRDKIGALQGGGVGFLAHIALAISFADGIRDPLGVVAMEPLVRAEKKAKKKKTRSTRAKRCDPDRESLKWFGTLEAASSALERFSPIHVMDREADIYLLLAKMVERGDRFVVRAGQDRSVQAGDETAQLFELLDTKRIRFRREVPVSPHKKADRQHPAREGRVAELGFSAARLLVRRPGKIKEGPETVALNFVHIVEIDPAEGATPIDWKLITTEKIGTTQDIEAIVDFYRVRWVIEEFFKALKTGCNVERAQLESLHALLNYVTLHLPIATRLLGLRSLEQQTPDAPASKVLTPLELEVLREMSPRPPPRKATVADVVRSVAALGGHIPNNGSPGWQVLGRGFRELVQCAAVCERLRAKRSDR